MNKQNAFSSPFVWMARFVISLFVAAVVVFPSNVMAIIIYDNGTFATGPTSNSGVAAPAGSQWSEAQNDYGVLTGSNTLAGFGCQKIGTTTLNRCADDFNVPVGQTWTIDKVLVYGYQTGFAGAASPFIAGFLQIWNGRPGDPGSTVIFGDLTTNRLGASTFTNTYRIFNSVAPPPGSAPGTTRRIWQNELTVSPGLALTAGNYWVEFTLDAGATGNFSPPVTTVGTRGVPFGNSRQATGTPPGTWADGFDDGNPATLPNVPQEHPFKLDGTVAGAPAFPRSRTGDYDGDNKTDLAVARASSASAQATWYIRNSNGGTITGANWGVGIGFPSGDRATPADFDGDGKTDIAVWRPGAATAASFFILNSAGNTLSIIPFGQTGDDPSIVGDYDGDGKADAAVYRDGLTATSTFFFRASNNNPGGNVSYVPFGLGGDRALQGDFDGDGRYDFQVARNNGGSAVHYRMINGSGAVSGFQFGLFTDRFVSGDYDADGRFETVAVRNSGANWDWYVHMTGNKQLFIERLGVAATDFVTPGDYDGDKKWDLAVWRSGVADARYFTRNTFTSPFTALWGSSTAPLTAPDYPIQATFVK